MSTHDAFNGAAREVVRGLQPQQQLPKQAHIWAAVRDDPVRTMNYVKQRTGFTGDQLAREVFVYSQEMRARYG